MRLGSFSLFVVVLAACDRKTTPKPEPIVDAAAPVVVLDAAVDASVDASAPDAGSSDDAGAARHRKLSLVKKKDKDGVALCYAVDASGNTVGHATAHDTAAGGSDVECDRIAVDGKVILFVNSRGTYAKYAGSGKDNDKLLNCGDGIFADDLSSCMDLDTSPFAYSDESDTENDDFDLSLCTVGLGRGADRKCVNLAKIRRGLNRSPTKPRPWDAAYCSNDRVVTVANGVLRLFEAPSGKPLAHVAVKGAARVTCEDGIVDVAKPALRFRVDDRTLEPLED